MWKRALRSIQKSLPEGVKIEPFLNRSDLVGRAIGTVSRNLIEGAIIVIFILVLLLGDMRAGSYRSISHPFIHAFCHFADESFWCIWQFDEPGCHRFWIDCRWCCYYCGECGLSYP